MPTESGAPHLHPSPNILDLDSRALEGEAARGTDEGG